MLQVILKRTRLIVVIGPQAYPAVSSLRAAAAAEKLALTHFVDCVFVEPDRYALILRDSAREIGCPSIVAPVGDYRMKVMAACADLVIHAPAGVGNRVWLLPRGEDAFSICLPPLPPRPAAKVPPIVRRVQLRSWCEAAADLLSTHPGNEQRH